MEIGGLLVWGGSWGLGVGREEVKLSLERARVGLGLLRDRRKMVVVVGVLVVYLSDREIRSVESESGSTPQKELQPWSRRTTHRPPLLNLSVALFCFT